MARDSETQALIDRIEASRRRLGGEIVGLKAKLNLPAQFRKQIARRPWLSFGASAAGGLLLAGILRRPRRQKKRRSRLVKWATPALLALLKPWLRSVVTRELQRRFLPAARSPEMGRRFPLSSET